MWFDKIKDFYEKGLWTKEMVYDGVKKGVITEEEYQIIITPVEEIEEEIEEATE